MTEKRFTFADGFKIVAVRDNGEIMNSVKVVDMLNTLNDENEQLKSSDTITDLETEIMNLKEENKFLRNKVATYKKGNALLKKTLDKEWK